MKIVILFLDKHVLSPKIVGLQLIRTTLPEESDDGSMWKTRLQLLLSPTE